jgi:hypothetical protein
LTRLVWMVVFNVCIFVSLIRYIPVLRWAISY